MRKIRYIQAGAVLMPLTWFLGSALPASAQRPPNDPIGSTVGGAVTAPARPVIVHEQTAAGWFVLVAVAAIVATLAVVAVVARLRRPSIEWA
jgi:hypothetical protein